MEIRTRNVFKLCCCPQANRVWWWRWAAGPMENCCFVCRITGNWGFSRGALETVFNVSWSRTSSFQRLRQERWTFSRYSVSDVARDDGSLNLTFVPCKESPCGSDADTINMKRFGLPGRGPQVVGPHGAALSHAPVVHGSHGVHIGVFVCHPLCSTESRRAMRVTVRYGQLGGLRESLFLKCDWTFILKYAKYFQYTFFYVNVFFFSKCISTYVCISIYLCIYKNSCCAHCCRESDTAPWK